MPYIQGLLKAKSIDLVALLTALQSLSPVMLTESSSSDEGEGTFSPPNIADCVKCYALMLCKVIRSNWNPITLTLACMGHYGQGLQTMMR